MVLRSNRTFYSIKSSKTTVIFLKSERMTFLIVVLYAVSVELKTGLAVKPILGRFDFLLVFNKKSCS